MASSPDNKRFNLAVARVIPPILLAIIIYACYAVTKPLCIDYLIRPLPKYARRSRTGTGAAIIAVFYVLLLPLIATYLRLLYNVVWNPDFLPLGSRPAQDQRDTRPSHRRSPEHHRRKKSRRNSKPTEILDKPEVDIERGVDNTVGGRSLPWDTAGLENFYKKDVFVCQPDGRPIYCSTCYNYKIDRSHHCREVGRCVRKMDHFCPWVGGVVSESSFKYFIQFIFYTTVFCAYTLIICAVFTAELRHHTGDVNAHWVIGIGLSSFFGIFTFGMTLSSLQLALYNLTTIENLSRRSVVWTLAIRVPNHVLARFKPGSQWAPTFHTITYPLPPMPPPPPSMPLNPESGEYHSIPPPPPPPQPLTGEQHVFAILQTLPGENPFDLGSLFKNLQQVLGRSIFDWFLPLKHSPCADHRSLESDFVLGPVVSRLRKEAGLELLPETGGNGPTGGRPKRKRRRGKHRHPE